MTEPRNLQLELLIKLLKMTTSSSDGEALLAARKANELLTKNDWEWDTLLRSKVTVMADPFMNTPIPPSSNGAHMPNQPPLRRSPPPPHRPAPQPNYAASPNPPRSYGSPPPKPIPSKVRANIYAGRCPHCQTKVDAGQGFAVIYTGDTKWTVQCQQNDSCSTIASLRAKPAGSAPPTKAPKQPKVAKGPKNLSDLMDHLQ